MKSFLKFMFKPAQGAFLLATSLLCIAGLTISFFSTSERTFIGILVLYAILVAATFVGSWLAYQNYRSTAPRLQRWNERKGRMEETILITLLVAFLLTACVPTTKYCTTYSSHSYNVYHKDVKHWKHPKKFRR